MSDDTLWMSFANCARAGEEIDALIETLLEILAGPDLGGVRIDPDTYEEEIWNGEQQWTWTYELYRHKLMTARGRPSSRGSLDLAVSFWRPEDERGAGWSGARIAKLYVAHSPPRSDTWRVDNLVADGVGRSPEAEPASAWRWTRGPTSANGVAWFFCVELLALRSREDLVREVVTPCKCLIEGQSDEIAFASCRAVIGAPFGGGAAKPGNESDASTARP